MTAPLPKISGSPEEILEHLRKKPELSALELALYDAEGRLLAVRDGSQAVFCGASGNLLCDDDCPQKRNDRLAFDQSSPASSLTACPGGMWHYLQPCQLQEGGLVTLVLGGVRGYDINLPYLENLALKKGLSASSLLEFWENIPALSERDMLEAGRVLRRHLSDFASNRPAASPSPLTAGLIRAVAETESGLTEADSPSAILNEISGMLTPHFTPRQIALFLPKSKNQPSNWIYPETARREPGESADSKNSPESSDNQITCLPLQFQNNLFGCMVLYAAIPSASDRLLLKIIADRIACRLDQLNDASAAEEQPSIPAEYLLNRLEILGTNRELRDLCRQILETAAQLAKAGKGSLMLLDGNSDRLRMLASIGLNRALAEEFDVGGDQSISKLVLKSGQPLLVTDMAKDPRIKIAHRPRFRTRSLLSLPLRSHQGLLGVLNLADKWDNSPFKESDLSLLSTWAGYCAPLIERLADSQIFQQLRNETAIDPVTGVYSQPLLERRFAEEVSRSVRSSQDLVLMLVAPDPGDEQDPDRPSSRECEKAVIKEMGNLLRKMDVIGRLTSGFFAVLLPDTPREGALTVAERLRLLITQQYSEQSFTISCGLAIFPRHGSNFPALLHSAETALLKARGDGGNATVFIDQIHKSDKIVYI